MIGASRYAGSSTDNNILVDLEGRRGGYKPLQPPSAAVPLIKKVLSQEDADDGWVNLAKVGKQLLNLAPDFDPRTFGFRKLSDLVRKTNQFEVQQGDGGPISIRGNAVG